MKQEHNELLWIKYYGLMWSMHDGCYYSMMEYVSREE